jgi:NitT/TauT family transport system ATP-binding protein
MRESVARVSDFPGHRVFSGSAVTTERPSVDRSIRLTDVSKTFETRGAPINALSRLNLSIESGEFVSVVGPSGCGKSTLLKIVAGLMRATSGTVRVAGKTVTKPHHDLGIVFQRDLLLESRTAIDNILLQVELRGLRKQPYVEKAHELLNKVGLSGFAHRYPREMSGGMRQRVGICRAMLHDPPIMLMDEPFGALDALTRDELTADLASICEAEQKTVLFITHSINEAVFLSDRVIVMTNRPARIATEIDVEIPRPRAFTNDVGALAFSRHRDQIRDLLLNKRPLSQEAEEL